MKYFKKSATFLTFAIGGFGLMTLCLLGCKSDNSASEGLESEIDSTELLNELKKEDGPKLPDLTVDKPIIKKDIDENFEANKVKIEKKFGDQWDFCRCIIVNDSLDKLIKAGADLDDKFMARFEEVDTKCKAFLVMSPNHTPDERSLHEKKIAECLKKR